MTTAEKTRSVAIVGAGPVGALMAVYLANRGWNVHVYETRPGKLNTKIIFFRGCFVLQDSQESVLHGHVVCALSFGIHFVTTLSGAREVMVS